MRLASLALLALFAVRVSAQAVDTNYAVTTQGDTLRTDIELRSPLLARTHVLVGGERREIEEFSFLHIDGETLAVVDGRTMARLVSDGRVRFFSHSTTTPGMFQAPMAPGGAPGFSPPTTSEVGYIQVEGGEVVEATNGALRDALGDNPTSVRYLDQSRTYGIAKWAGLAVGTAAFVAGAVPMIQANQRGEEIQVNPLVVVGIGLAGGSQFLFSELQDNARDRAIDAYNAD